MRGSTARARASGGALLLAAGERDPALAHERLEALREVAHVLGELRDLGRPLGDAPSRSPSLRRTPKATFSRTVSEKRNVSWGTKPTAPRSVASGIRAHVVAVHEQRARRRVEEPREEADEGALAGAGRARRSPPWCRRAPGGRCRASTGSPS